VILMKLINKFDVEDDSGYLYSLTVYSGKNIAPPGYPPIEGLRTYRLNDGRTAVPTVKGDETEFKITGTDILIRKIP
jgi:hypothetical protein